MQTQSDRGPTKCPHSILFLHIHANLTGIMESRAFPATTFDNKKTQQ